MGKPQRIADGDISLGEIYLARRAIAPFVRRTPLVESDSLRDVAGTKVSLKLESLQDTGSFKLRGATNAILALDPEAQKRGVVTVSTGNHGRAVARAAVRLGVRAVVCLSELVPGNKRRAIEALGAELRVGGRSQDEAQLEADKLAAEDGLSLIPPFDHADVIAGQGTIGLEILDDAPDVTNLLVPLSGGGLIAGIARAVKAANPDCRITGISMTRGPAMHASLEAGKPVAVEEHPSLADSLGGGIGLDNQYTFAMVRRYVDDVILLEENEIADGMRHLFREERLVTEGGAAVGVATLLHRRAKDLGSHAIVLVSGCNVDMNSFLEVITDGKGS